ncbi:pleckstrin homology domain-containing family S member 1 isoform X3 [Centrocercus urophasianus]|uniref:pleckstrin homology domain-containing family S member 1 isoform X3 n=1 Tax=Centrocercus urophasianus TaxID=9002 RepID=UPI001C64CB66|nr:pleckstrin homology domain-containing family S member 1 isoform X3 [Centrocercus urophasianus]
MASRTAKNSEVEAQNPFCPEGGLFKHGFFIKSPPHHLINSKNSWKRRFFILSKSNKGDYILKYLKGMSMKGSIAVDQIISVEIGISNSETMVMVRKMFRCFPEEVISITTENRCYYLIGKSRLEIEDWVTAISSIREAKKGGCCPQNQDLANSEVKSRSFSMPLFSNSIDMTGSPRRQSYLKDDGASEDKNRPNSDPGPHQAQSNSPQGVLPRLDKTLGKTEENLSSDSNEDLEKEEEPYYQTPSSLLAKCNSEISEIDPTAEPDIPVQEKPCQRQPEKENAYESMESLLTCRHDRLHSPPRSLENSASPSSLEADTDVNLPQSTTQQSFLKRRQNSSPLSVVQLSILLSQVTDKTQLQELDILVPLADINSYLKLTEAAGQICVSQWTGPCRLGCLFNHGDCIVAVNGLHPQNMEEASLFISRSTQKEVKLTVCRIPHSDTFHAKGCSCS